MTSYGLDLGLKDVHVLITGANGGIGIETAKLFHSQGALVTAHYNRSSTSLDPFLAGTDRAKGQQADLRDEKSVQALFANAASVFGPVQILVVNHAVSEDSYVGIGNMSLDQWNRIIDTNLTSSFLVSREYIRGLAGVSENAKESANIVFIGSTAGKYGEAGNSAYAASKSALMYGLTLSLKNEIVKVAPRGRVNTVAPGWVRTPMAEHALQNPDIIYMALATTPLKKIAEPIDVANQIIVLASSKISGHVSGEVQMVHGGMEGRLLNNKDTLDLPPSSSSEYMP